MVGAKQGTILIVDDASENLEMLSRILASDGYAIHSANNGEEAINSAQMSPPDIILLDINMPVMDGFETCARLKKDKRTHDIPVIFISALDNIEDKVKAFRAGGEDYILKPFEIEEIEARVETHLAILRLRIQLQSANRELATRLEALTRSQELLRERESKLRAFVSALPNLSFVFDEQGRYLEILANETSLLSAKVDELMGRLIKDVMPTQVAESMMEAIRRAIETGKTQTIEYRVSVLAGDERWFEGRVALMEKDRAGHSKVVFIAADISERVRLYQEVRRMAMQDPLTGCFNRRHFLTLAEQELQRAIRYKRSFSLVMLDIDHFKKFNDQYGHPAGDQLLCALVNLCHGHLRSIDMLGRYGGEEFMILMSETGADAALQAAERLRGKIEKMKIDTTEGKLSVTVSIGVASFDATRDQAQTVDMLVKRADDALYAAKAAGRNCARGG